MRASGNASVVVRERIVYKKTVKNNELNRRDEMLGEYAALESILRKLDGSLRKLYGKLNGGLVLYGSHARGEADEGSDVDVLLLLEGTVETGREIRRSSEAVARLSLESGYTLSVIPVSVEDYRRSTEPYLMNARREGKTLTPAG